MSKDSLGEAATAKKPIPKVAMFAIGLGMSCVLAYGVLMAALMWPASHQEQVKPFLIEWAPIEAVVQPSNTEHTTVDWFANFFGSEITNRTFQGKGWRVRQQITWFASWEEVDPVTDRWTEVQLDVSRNLLKKRLPQATLQMESPADNVRVFHAHKNGALHGIVVQTVSRDRRSRISITSSEPLSEQSYELLEGYGQAWIQGNVLPPASVPDP